MVWAAIELLRRWERDHLPGADTPQGTDVLVWLLKSEGRKRPLKDLYRSSSFSEPTLRACLQVFVQAGFVTFETGGKDSRMRLAQATPKLAEAVNAYRERFREAAILVEHGTPANAATSANVTLPFGALKLAAKKPPRSHEA